MKDICEPLKNTVAIHFRDYKMPNIYPECTSEYYDKTLKYFPGKQTVVFTDNIEKAKQVIGIDCEYRSGTPIEDFYLMSKCDNVICSNSTFSWWAAWLTGRTAIIPAVWFAGRLSSLSTEGYKHPNFISL
jgi:hypothetical protein